MVQVEFQEAEAHFAEVIAKAEAGETLTIVKDGRAVASIAPAPKAPVSEKERQRAMRTLNEIMYHGYDMGGYKITSRDELYDRD